jgi:hypothetical protein
MFVATKDKILPTAMIGSFPRPTWFTENLRGRPFKVALGDSLYREGFAKLFGARPLLWHFMTLSVTKIVKFLGQADSHPE